LEILKQSKVFDNNSENVVFNFFVVKFGGKSHDIIVGTDHNNDISGLTGGHVIQDSDRTDKIILARMKIPHSLAEVTNTTIARLWMVL
jgi:hypothetical protein